MMKVVSIIAHSTDAFIVSHYNFETLKRIIEDTIYILAREYGEELLLNISSNCSVGIDKYISEIATLYGIKYHVYLPTNPENLSKDWTDEEKQKLEEHINNSKGLIILEPNESDIFNYLETNYLMVNNSDFVVSFWVGKKRGRTTDTIRYSLDHSKLVINAMNGMKLIFKQDLENGWTPPHMNEALNG